MATATPYYKDQYVKGQLVFARYPRHRERWVPGVVVDLFFGYVTVRSPRRKRSQGVCLDVSCVMSQDRMASICLAL